jgi:multifunctional cyclase/dehydratase/O-methyltransferase
LTAPANPETRVFEIVSHVLLARVLGVVAELGIADLLAQEPLSAEELAGRVAADADALYRLLRMLASHGFFAERDDGRFELTPLAQTLRSDHPGAIRDLLAQPWQDLAWDTYRALPAAVRSGEVAFELAHGRGFFEHLAAHPEAGAAFDRIMATVAEPENAVIAAQYDFGRMHRVADIGGGHGGLLAAILKRYPHLRGVLCEQPQVLEDPSYLKDAQVLDRCELVPVDFFDSVPPGCDLYLLKRVLHDWDDDQAVQILGNCHRALAPGGRLAVIDAVMLPGNAPDPNKTLDVSIMVLTRGRERTGADFERLLSAAGLRLLTILPPSPPSTLSIVEAGPTDA